jgi:hypothetical protein
MVLDIVGLHQRTDTIEEGTTRRLQAVNLLVAELVTIEGDTTGKATYEAHGRRCQHHRLIVMADTTAMMPRSEVQGAL